MDCRRGRCALERMSILSTLQRMQPQRTVPPKSGSPQGTLITCRRHRSHSADGCKAGSQPILPAGVPVDVHEEYTKREDNCGTFAGWGNIRHFGRCHHTEGNRALFAGNNMCWWVTTLGDFDSAHGGAS